MFLSNARRKDQSWIFMMVLLSTMHNYA